MRILIVLLLVSCLNVSISIQQNVADDGTLDSISLEPCDESTDISGEYRSALYEFTLTFFKAISFRGGLNFVYSPVSMWLILAAVAEGADPYTQRQLFQILRLSNNLCIRKKYYQLAASCLVFSDDIKIVSNRVWLIDDGITPNTTWHDFVKESYFLEVVRAAIRYNPEATANDISRLLSAPLPRLNLIGNSVLLDSMDYSGLWTTAFADATIERAPFYNQQGYPLGAVDLMRVKRRVRMGYIKSLNAKVLELPVGSNRRYRMLFAMFLESNDDVRGKIGGFSKDLLMETVGSLKESAVLLDIAIPRMIMSTVTDVRTLLEDLGVTSLWNDPAATRHISHPAALPSSFIQRATLTLNQFGLSPSPVEDDPPYGTPTGLDPILGSDFIANRPFLFALFDTKTYTCVLASAYSLPTFL